MRQDLRLTRSDPDSSRAACCESLRYGRNLSQVHTQFLQILSTAIFEKMPIYQLLTENRPQEEIGVCANQLSLFDL